MKTLLLFSLLTTTPLAQASGAAVSSSLLQSQGVYRTDIAASQGHASPDAVAEHCGSGVELRGESGNKLLVRPEPGNGISLYLAQLTKDKWSSETRHAYWRVLTNINGEFKNNEMRESDHFNPISTLKEYRENVAKVSGGKVLLEARTVSCRLGICLPSVSYQIELSSGAVLVRERNYLNKHVTCSYRR